jgi:GTPase SAR1 family protein
MGNLRETTAKMMHHDSITGSSLIYIVYNETLGMQRLLEKNSEIMQTMFKEKILRDHGLRLDELLLCSVKINDRNLCPDPTRARRT